MEARRRSAQPRASLLAWAAMLAPLHIRVCGSMLVVFLRVTVWRRVDVAKSRTSHVRAAVSVRAVAPPGCFLSSLNGIDHGDMRGLGVSKPLSNHSTPYSHIHI